MLKKISKDNVDLFMIKKILSLEPWLCVSMIVEIIISAISSLFTVILMERIVDGLVRYDEVDHILWNAGALFFIGIASALLNRLVSNQIKMGDHRLSDSFDAYLTEISMNVEYQLLEDENYLALRDKAYRPIRNQGSLRGYIDSVKSLIQNFAVILSMMIYLSVNNVFVILVIVGTVIIIRYLQNKKLKVDEKYEDEMAVIDRRYEYYDKLLCDMSFGKEVRLFEMKEYLMRKIHSDNEKTLGHTFRQLHREYGRVDGVCGFLKQLELAAIHGLLIFDVVRETLSIGGFSGTVAAALSLSRAMNSSIEYYFEFMQHRNHLKGFVNFCTYSEASLSKQDVSNTEKVLFPIVVKNVSFSYPGATKKALDRINLTFEAGKKYALVGENGAGKTTLIRLLLGYYSEFEGTITNIKDNEEAVQCNLRTNCIPLFQNSQVYPVSLIDNITLETEANEQRLSDYLSWSKLNIIAANLKAGYHTTLCRDFDSNAVDLSGGEKQKVGLIRALLNSHSLLILDEPTSSMDATTEVQVIKEISTLSDTESVIFVSHRMACCRFCDEVIVMRSGQVVGKGTHEELLRENEEYKRLWNAQASRYQEVLL